MKEIKFSYTRQKFFSGFDGKFCKIYPIIATDSKTALMCYSMLLLSGSDVFYGKYIAKSCDGGKTFDEPLLQENLKDTFKDGIRTAYSVCPLYNKTHNKWFGLGQAEFYEDDKTPICRGGVALSQPLYASLDPEAAQFSECSPLPFPLEYTGAIPMPQILELENGDILVPFYFTSEENVKCRCVTVRYDISSDEPKIVSFGEPLCGDSHKRGICEPSLAKLGDKVYMTIRCDETAYWAESDDGLNFGNLREWTFDNGKAIGNYNTQQHWISHKDGLFLAYTRKGAHNEHVFRHRAPIFMARFDTESSCLIKDSEVILVPELGARLGNFGVIETENESWLSVAEWMQPHGCDKYGSDNSVWIAKVKWEDE